MNIYSLICTRDARKPTRTLVKLCKYLQSMCQEVKIMANQSSIFEAYSVGVSKFGASDEDLIIMCHDDIEIMCDTSYLRSKLESFLSKGPKTGFLGPAGTTFLGETAVWWDKNAWLNGFHRGAVSHTKDDGEVFATSYGPEGQVVVLDGLFLAARKQVLDEIGLEKPKYFEGEWDFYDIHYTSKAHQLGYENYAIDFPIIHHSRGELVGRDSWHKNRQAFIENTCLPIKLS